MRTTDLIAACTLLLSVHAADSAESLPRCDPMPVPIVQPSAGEPHPHRPGDLYWTGTIVVSFTIAADGAIKHAQARINEGLPARHYRFGRAIQIIENPLPAPRQRAEEDAKRDALQMVSTLRYPSRAVECQGEFIVTFKLPSD